MNAFDGPQRRGTGTLRANGCPSALMLGGQFLRCPVLDSCPLRPCLAIWVPADHRVMTTIARSARAERNLRFGGSKVLLDVICIDLYPLMAETS